MACSHVSCVPASELLDRLLYQFGLQCANTNFSSEQTAHHPMLPPLSVLLPVLTASLGRESHGAHTQFSEEPTSVPSTSPSLLSSCGSGSLPPGVGTSSSLPAVRTTAGPALASRGYDGFGFLGRGIGAILLYLCMVLPLTRGSESYIPVFADERTGSRGATASTGFLERGSAASVGSCREVGFLFASHDH